MTDKQRFDRLSDLEAQRGPSPTMRLGQREWKYLTLAEMRYALGLAERDEGTARPPLNSDEQRELDLMGKAVTMKYEGDNEEGYAVCGAAGLTLKESVEMAALNAR